MWSFRNHRLLEPVDVTVANLMAALGRGTARLDPLASIQPVCCRRYAYRESEERVGQLTTAPGAKSRAVRLAIESFHPGQALSIAELERACPAVSRATIRRVLGQLREQGQIECLGTGRSARWKRL